MKQSSFFQRYWPDLVAVLGFLVLASIYFAPAWQGKQLTMSDVQQSMAAARELADFKATTGRQSGWTNALFGGMPAYMISYSFPNTYVGSAVYWLIWRLPASVNLIFLEMLTMYLLLAVLGIRRWLAGLGAVAYALGTFNLLSLEAGHISKIYALAFAPGFVAGVVLALRGRYLAGAVLTALFMCLEIMANHIQITYYTVLATAVFVVIEGVAMIRRGQLRQLLVAVGVLAGAAMLGAGSYAGRLLVLNQFTAETIRGRSELTAKTTSQKPDGSASSTPDAEATERPQNGLDKEYAFQWSYGLGETITLMLPNAYGGASNGGLTTNSDLYKAMLAQGIDPSASKQFVEDIVPVYWGDQPFVGGPAYAGAVLLFLFVLSLFVSTNPMRWAALGGALLLISLAWGRHFFLNQLLFDYLPYFNKFRAPTMSLALAQLFLVLGAALGLQELLDRKPTWAQLQRPLFISLGLTAGLAALLAVAGGALLSFRTANDAGLLGRYFGDSAGQFVMALVSDRQSVLRADALRAMILILLAAAMIWLYVQNRLKANMLAIGFLLLVTFDLFNVDKRFVNDGDFGSRQQAFGKPEPTAADQQILADKSLSFRVLDVTGNFSQDNRASNYHKSIGGYNAAKLRRYQELLEFGFPKNQLQIINMLNGKYIIQPAVDSTGQPAPGEPGVQQNPDALGNAWFVNRVQPVADADAEMAALQTLTPRETALVDKRFASQLAGLPALDPTGASIRLTAYEPDHLTYESNAPREQVAVFSEVYYRGDADWNAYIDGKKAPHFRANYVLRAMRVPAGSHKIEFRFEPPMVALGNTIDLVFNILLIALLAFGLFRLVRSVNQPGVAETIPAAPPTSVPVAEPLAAKSLTAPVVEKSVAEKPVTPKSQPKRKR
jgi:hypothetical protein